MTHTVIERTQFGGVAIDDSDTCLKNKDGDSDCDENGSDEEDIEDEESSKARYTANKAANDSINSPPHQYGNAYTHAPLINESLTSAPN